MKATALNLLLGATLLLAPWLISRLAQGGITDLFHVGALPSVQENVNVKVSAESKLTCDDFDSCPEDSSLVANPFLVPCGHKCHKETCCLINNRGDEVQEASTTDESSLTCDDFASCPQGWSLVASPSLVLCGKTCEKETCCLDDAVAEVLHDKAGPRRLEVGNDTTTVTTTTTVYEPPQEQSNVTNATATTATTTATATVTTTITETTTETVTATLTERGDRETVLSGYIILTIPNAQAFMDDTKAVDAFKEAVAETVSVPTSWVDLVFHLGLKRRLSDTDGGAHLRRLQSNKLTVDYTITIPGSAEKPTTGLGSDVNAASINTALVTEIYNSFTATLQAKLVAAGVTAGTYTITTEKINAPVITLKTFTTTSTMTNPDLEDDSLAFTRVPLSLAHALALLAVSASALSF